MSNTADLMEAAILPEAYAVHVPQDNDAMPVEEGTAARHSDPSQKSPAEWAYDRMVMYIQNFEKLLDKDHEVSLGFAGSEAGTIKIDGMGFFAPDMITFFGKAPDGAPMQLVQHVSQMNVILVAERKPEEMDEPNRIGFQLRGNLNAEG